MNAIGNLLRERDVSRADKIANRLAMSSSARERREKGGGFNAEQCRYLKIHRDTIFVRTRAWSALRETVRQITG
ncbi:MAG: hypothetical protein QOC89_3922 [Paraburkholderia sp.]|nr:hypothetical protein [Paraburkholderia sp.]